MYLDYEEYLNMGGTLDETAFDNFEFEAEAIINYYTFNRLKKSGISTYPSEVKKLAFKLIDLAQKQEASMTLGLSSTSGEGTIVKEANDGVSVEYNRIDASDLFNLCKDAVPQYVNKYLSGVMNELGQNLLFRGVYPDE